MRKLFTLGALTAGCLLVARVWLVRAWRHSASVLTRSPDDCGEPWDWR